MISMSFSSLGKLLSSLYRGHLLMTMDSSREESPAISRRVQKISSEMNGM